MAAETELKLTPRVHLLYLTDTANTRVFKVKPPSARTALVGGDNGPVEREQLLGDVVRAPSERVIVDVLFEHSGALALERQLPGICGER